ncbi:hypothetical protein D3C75_1036330 [compost metagenome]
MGNGYPGLEHLVFPYSILLLELTNEISGFVVGLGLLRPGIQVQVQQHRRQYKDQATE